MAVETNIGRVAFTDKGAYSSTTVYNKWDFVTTTDSTYLYIATTPQSGKPVTDTAYWKCIANGKQATTAAQSANTAAATANTAAGLADDARLAIQTDLDKKLESDVYSVPDNIQEVKKWVSGVKTAINVKTVPQAVINPETNKVSGYDEEETVAQAINDLAERIGGLELAFRNMTLNKVQTDTLDVLVNLNYQGRPLFVIGTAAPGTVPDGVPQFYINTTNGDFYSAKNTTAAGDWILI